MTTTTEQATRIEGSIPASLPVREHEQFLFISRDQGVLTHGLHKYPAKFFPELPRWLIERYSEPGDLVLDPFMGSGTTNVEASLLDRPSIGVDVDPFSRFLARVKVTPLSPRGLKKAYGEIRAYAESYAPSQSPGEIPEFPYRDNWFKPYILQELAYLQRGIEDLDAPRSVKNFFLVCFSSTIRQVSEADNNCTRTVVRKKLGKKVLEGAAIKLFIRRIDKQTQNMMDFSAQKPSGRVVIPENADARSLVGVRDNSVDLAITSPPYLNAVDYPRTHQLEMYWLGFERGSLQPLKRCHVGTEAVYASEYRMYHRTGCALADRLIEQIFEIDPRRAYIASKFMDDMFSNLQEVRRVLKPGGKYVIVVGNNLVRGHEFETWRYLMDKAPDIGYSHEQHFVSKIINHFIKVPRKERINDDHVLVLRK